MIATLLGQVKQYQKDSILTPFFTAVEVLMEVLIPFVTAQIIDKGIEAGNIENVYSYGLLMLVLAAFSLVSGILAGTFAARASSGFACNLRDGMYENIQTFSFSNIDRYSTAGLVTRMTTDVTNVQNAYQMILRMCVRAPLMLVVAMSMTFMINAKLAMIFFYAMIFLGAILGFITLKAYPMFSKTFRKYDDLNASVQENVTNIRVVKAYVKENAEIGKFKEAVSNLKKMFMKAENIRSCS
mgnify:CR=1 FL=1